MKLDCKPLNFAPINRFLCSNLTSLSSSHFAQVSAQPCHTTQSLVTWWILFTMFSQWNCLKVDCGLLMTGTLPALSTCARWQDLLWTEPLSGMCTVATTPLLTANQEPGQRVISQWGPGLASSLNPPPSMEQVLSCTTSHLCCGCDTMKHLI